MSSVRNQVMTILRQKADEVRNARYYAKRGVIAWPSWDFDTRPHAIAVMMDETQLFRPADQCGVMASGSMEFCTRIPKNQAEARPEIDDDVLDEMVEDAAEILTALQNATTQPEGDPLLFKFDKRTSVVAEFSDVALMIQGIVVTFQIEY